MKPIETVEMLPGGKILLTERTRQDLTSHQMEVLDIGAPGICGDEDCERPHCEITERGWDYLQTYWGHDIDVSVGDWVLVAHRSLSETEQDGIFICSQDAVIARLCA